MLLSINIIIIIVVVIVTKHFFCFTSSKKSLYILQRFIISLPAPYIRAVLSDVMRAVRPLPVSNC